MSDSRSFKPGSRPGTLAQSANTVGPKERPGADPTGTAGSPSAGRIVHDDRGNAVWDWVKDTARVAIESTSRLLKKLEVPELKLEDTHKELRIESGRDAGRGYDPYGQGPAHRGQAPAMDGRKTGGATRASTANKDPGGGYDPYGKGITRKPSR